ncbi:unnamed protein product [Camellia sinensis]
MILRNAQKVIRKVLEYFAFAAKVRLALLSLNHMRVGLLVASLTYTSIHQMESLYELSLKLSQLRKLFAEENDDLFAKFCNSGPWFQQISIWPSDSYIV